MSEFIPQKQMLVDAILMLERAQVIDFNGHFSWRVPGHERLLINSGKSVRSALTIDDIVTIDFDGNLIEGDAVPPMEFPIHAEIYRRRPDVHSVVHSHPVWSTLFSMTDRTVEPVIMQAAVLGEIRRFGKTASINKKPLAEELADVIGPHRVAMLKSHGAVIAAEGILEAFVLAFYLEENAHRQYLALQLGEPMVLSAEQIESIGRNLWKPNLLQKVWDYHAGKLQRERVSSR
ncbi:class II aldolase/adducin family protein [Paraburkholderia sp. LEh10]|uniref:class II aldolase/adducin family protein n=1 Tax=Paraburkholderia sp. LEh10 TaxID=2821353 RepID=UPI001AEA1907|nr:class II aldolase/adducin family protein [Paraburkholderia sp. LEh10]MBP0592156.1 class II aldolase/adducin family protein [Paraburkholderia sp. LEh10]